MNLLFLKNMRLSGINYRVLMLLLVIFLIFCFKVSTTLAAVIEWGCYDGCLANNWVKGDWRPYMPGVLPGMIPEGTMETSETAMTKEAARQLFMKAFGNINVSNKYFWLNYPVPQWEYFPSTVGLVYQPNTWLHYGWGDPVPHTQLNASTNGMWHAGFYHEGGWGYGWYVASGYWVIPSPPSVDLKANNSDGPIIVSPGGSVILTWSTVNADSCLAASTANDWSGSKSASSLTGETMNYITSSRTYTLTCTNAAGSASDNVIINVSSPPIATDLRVSQPDYCLVSWPSAIFSWQFRNQDGGAQSAYRIQVDNNADFSSPEVDSGKVMSSSNSYAAPSGKLPFNNTYYWRLMVWNNLNLSSVWLAGPSFTVPRHPYPRIDFSWMPQNPAVNEIVQFVDKSRVSVGTVESSLFWTFQGASPASSVLKNPLVKFLSLGAKSVTLKVTDSDGFSCTGQKTTTSLMPLPGWIEIPPF